MIVENFSSTLKLNNTGDTDPVSRVLAYVWPKTLPYLEGEGVRVRVRARARVWVWVSVRVRVNLKLEYSNSLKLDYPNYKFNS